jgi:pyruvate,orthophosphate dikinase
MTKWVYCFGDGTAEGRADMRNLLGGKGAGLAEMSNLGLPVPPGFTITTEVCSYLYSHGETYPDELRKRSSARSPRSSIRLARFGDPDNPLLVSVRLGARVSMPGMMDTVLNLGLNDRVVEGWRAEVATSVSPTTVIAALSRCTGRWCWASRTISRS